jgi:hypothetical protein
MWALYGTFPVTDELIKDIFASPTIDPWQTVAGWGGRGNHNGKQDYGRDLPVLGSVIARIRQAIYEPLHPSSEFTRILFGRSRSDRGNIAVGPNQDAHILLCHDLGGVDPAHLVE